ncbi:hypothetical protein [Plantactinospora sonchi]|uniref:Uncharacterized protein n=1 Tax=Plantactinospora sonchi TaxID=1544735 RepID=A0ABU7RPZ2_9ACTN
MAVRGWGGSLATAVGVAAGAGAAQLGLGYGLGIVAWLPSTDAVGEATWLASLTWAVWIAATSTVVGAICAVRLGRPADAPYGAVDPTPASAAPATGLWRAALAVAAAIGGLVTVVLVSVPARTATRADDLSPQTVAAGYAVVGVLIGLLVAFWAISSPAVAGNILGTTVWLWVLAVVAVVDDVLSDGGPLAAQLGVWQLTTDGERFWFRDHLHWPAATLALGSALLIGALAARSAARRPATRVGATISGMAGPALVAAGYFVVAPRLAEIRAEQVSAHLIAPYAVAAGVAGSALVAALAQRAEALAGTHTGRPRTPAALPGPVTGTPEESEPPAPGVRVPSQPTAERRDGIGGRPTDGSAATPSRHVPVIPADDASAVPPGDRTAGPTRDGTAEPTGAGGPAGGDSPAGAGGSATGGGPAGGNGATRVGGDEAPGQDAPTAAGESAGDPKPKGRLGRFGRRSR